MILEDSNQHFHDSFNADVLFKSHQKEEKQHLQKLIENSYSKNNFNNDINDQFAQIKKKKQHSNEKS